MYVRLAVLCIKYSDRCTFLCYIIANIIILVNPYRQLNAQNVANLYF